MKKEKIGQNFFFFLLDCEDRGLEFWGLVGSSTGAKSVTKKPKQKKFQPEQHGIQKLC